MPFALVRSAIAGGDASSVATGAVDTSGANLLVATLGWYVPGGVPNIADSKTNLGWQELTRREGGSGMGNVLYYCLNPTVGAGHVFSSTAQYPLLGVLAFSGAPTAGSFEAQAGAIGTAGTLAPGSLTPAEDNELLVTGVSYGWTTDTAAIDAGYTALVTAHGAAFSLNIAYKIQTALAAANPTWTVTAGGYGNAASHACFKAAAGASGPLPFRTRLHATRR